VAGLTASCYLLIFIFALVPANRHRSLIFGLNLTLLAASLVDFSTAIVMFHSRINSPQTPAPVPLFVINTVSTAAVKTIAEAILLLRVKVVFPGRRVLLWMGVLLIAARTVTEIAGKILFWHSNYVLYQVLLVGPSLEILDNIVFTALFLYRLRLRTQSKVLKSKFTKLRAIAIENWLLPTAFSIFATAMIAVGHLPSGYQAGTSVCYVMSIPLATMWAVGDTLHSQTEKVSAEFGKNATTNNLNTANQLEYFPESSDSLLDQPAVASDRAGLYSNSGWNTSAICLAEIAPWTTSDCKATCH
jgi:hypothetical protein